MYRNPSEPTAHLVTAKQRSTTRALGQSQAPTWSDVVCVTLYNEPLEALDETLASLVASAAVAHRAGQLKSLCVCLMADGAEREDPGVSDWLDTLQPWQVDPDRVDVASLQARPWHSARKWMTAAHWAWMVHLIVYRKPVNRGKLHSHAVFFTDLCQRLQPSRCWQVDVGTRVDPQAMDEMIGIFKADAQVGAVGSRVELAMPAADCSYVQRWQYMDFAMQASSLWPAESATRHMSVVPGQFCAVRWEAMRRGGDSAPMHQYLRGLQTNSRMDRIMFLAEDRVIGNELVLAEGRPWRLAYGHRAQALTDPCGSFSELLRQRRRWHNSSFACRLWLLQAWPREMQRADRDLPHKLSFSVAMGWQALLALVQCLTPAMSLAVVMTIVGALVIHAQQGGVALSVLTAVCMGVATTGALLSGPRLSAWYRVLRDLSASAALLLYGLVLYQLGGAALVGVFLGPMLALAVLPVWVLPGRRWTLLRHVGEYWLLQGLCQTVLWAYAMRHLSDTSWGTKGLVQAGGGTNGAPSAQKGRYEASVLALTVVANVGALGACAWTGVAGLPGGAVVAVGSAVLLVTFLAAIAGHLQLGCSRWWRLSGRTESTTALSSDVKEQNA